MQYATQTQRKMLSCSSAFGAVTVSVPAGVWVSQNWGVMILIFFELGED
jgi:hypothetical protein